jgi:hypothetical protein
LVIDAGERRLQGFDELINGTVSRAGRVRTGKLAADYRQIKEGSAAMTDPVAQQSMATRQPATTKP